MTTVAEALLEATRKLRAAGLEEPRREASLLLRHAAGLAPEEVLARPERPLSRTEEARFDVLVARRRAREPAAYILGEREFWGLPFRVTPATLVPRPETETLVEAALAQVADRDAPLRVLDLGTGSGCLLFAVLSELPCATGLGVDADEAALAVARDNASRLGLTARARFRHGDWGRGLEEIFDLILSNPPYVADDDLARLEPEVAYHEPRTALAGGRDGLDAYRRLADDVARLLAPDGVALLEVGAGQAAKVAGVLAAAGLRADGVRRDLAGIERCVILRRAGAHLPSGRGACNRHPVAAPFPEQTSANTFSSHEAQ
jgi:release factor glutamine methyltransferase